MSDPLRPEDVAAEAQRRAAERGEGRAEPGGPPEPVEADLRDRLTRWAFIDVEPDEVMRSTRRLGAPITALKRGLARLLTQYHREEHGQLTRFNLQLLGYVERLERRVAQLEDEVARLRGEERDADGEPDERRG